MKYDDFDVDNLEMNLRAVLNTLESIGSNICGVEGSGDTWHEINNAIHHIQESIHNTFKMRN